MRETFNKVSGYRNMLGLTQREVAAYLGITSQSYSNKERGYRGFSDDEKVKLKKLFQRIDSSLTIDSIFFSNLCQKSERGKGYGKL